MLCWVLRESARERTAQTANFAELTSCLELFIVYIRKPSATTSSLLPGAFKVIDFNIILIQWSAGLLGRRVIDLNVRD